MCQVVKLPSTLETLEIAMKYFLIIFLYIMI